MALLPWAHAFGKTVELILFPSIGMAIDLAESNRSIAQNILEVNPTVVLGVPQIFNQIFNRIYDVIHAKIIISGPIVMQGYPNAPKANAEVFTETGELRGVDMGYLDDEGYLWITGRVKEQYKLENGKYIVPSVRELKITASPQIDQAVMFGSAKTYNIVLILTSFELIKPKQAHQRK